MRQIGSLYKLTDYLKIVEFFTLKTSQCKKGNNADSKKYTLSVRNLHSSLIFLHSKILFKFAGHHNWANLIVSRFVCFNEYLWRFVLPLLIHKLITVGFTKHKYSCYLIYFKFYRYANNAKIARLEFLQMQNIPHNGNCFFTVKTRIVLICYCFLTSLTSIFNFLQPISFELL